jgi:1-acyl-sn-glycerol-3-phosphate acyltransferase
VLSKIFFGLKIYGRESFPETGPLIVASNHASFLDPVIVGVGAPEKLDYLARDTLFRFRPFARLLYMVNVSPIKRETGDINAFKLILNKLSKGRMILIFPEGTRSNDGSLQDAKSGIGFLQSVSGAEVLPCYVKGSIEAWPRHSKFPKFSPVSVYFGKPLRFGTGVRGDKKDNYMYIANKVMEAIGELKKNADQSS